jgi:hypothetical protein
MLSRTLQCVPVSGSRLVRRRLVLAVASAMSVSFAGCTTFPDSMHLDMRGIELVPSSKYVPTRARDELALAILFEGRAPFATIAATWATRTSTAPPRRSIRVPA